MADDASVVGFCPVHAVGTGQQTLVAVVKIINSRYVLALLAGRRTVLAQHTGSVAGLTAEIRQNLVLPVQTVCHARLLVNFLVVGSRSSRVHSALLTIVEVAGLAQRAPSLAGLAELCRGVGVQTCRTGGDATVGGSVEVVA